MKALTGVPVGWVVDAMGRQGAIDYRIRALTIATAFTGVALTVRSRARDNLAPYAAIGYAEPGDAMVIETGDHEQASVVGDILLGIARNKGIVACVTDGMVRDIDGLNEVGMPVFARGLSPNSPFKDGPGEIGLSVVIGGITIHSGDILVADKNGVVVVPRGRAAEVVANLRSVAAKEAQMDDVVRGGAKEADWLQATFAAKGVRFID
ncbi:MAG: RraA family protein [Myxococcales bacterium]|nr:RraA family protein [Myxococcales bacterium]